MSSSDLPRLFESAAHAELYRKFRPDYPTSVLDKILSFLSEKHPPPFEVAVDVGCGSGQGTRFLAPHFKEVVGVDVSDGQLHEARKITKEENVVYRKGSGENVPVPDSSVDLITCAQSMHWFDMGKFFAECDRVLKPNGCIAAYGNGIPLPYTSNQEIQRIMQELFMEIYRGVLGPYTDERRRHVANLYRDIHLPYKEFKRDTTLVKKNVVRVEDVLGFIESLSSYQIYIKKFPEKGDFLSEYKIRFLDILQPLNPSVPPEEIEFEFVAPIFILLGRKVFSEKESINHSKRFVI